MLQLILVGEGRGRDLERPDKEGRLERSLKGGKDSQPTKDTGCLRQWTDTRQV